MIRNLLIAACLALPVAAMAADETKPAEKKMTAQQQKMGACNREAGDKKLAGDERKKFMSDCLKAGNSGAAGEKKMTAQQQKMSSCNKEAGDKKGDDRKKFMQSCLKG